MCRSVCQRMTGRSILPWDHSTNLSFRLRSTTLVMIRKEAKRCGITQKALLLRALAASGVEIDPADLISHERDTPLPMPASFTKLSVAEIVQAYAAGKGLEEIARRQGCSSEAVRYRLLKAGVVLRGRGRPRIYAERWSKGT